MFRNVELDTLRGSKKSDKEEHRYVKKLELTVENLNSKLTKLKQEL